MNFRHVNMAHVVLLHIGIAQMTVMLDVLNLLLIYIFK